MQKIWINIEMEIILKLLITRIKITLICSPFFPSPIIILFTIVKRKKSRFSFQLTNIFILRAFDE